MKKVAIMLVVAVIIPSLVLAWMAFRSIEAQQLALERQRSLHYRGVAQSLAKDILGMLVAVENEFRQTTETLLAGFAPFELARGFDAELSKRWPLAEVGFAISVDGQMISPSLLSHPEARQFRLENERFLTGRETAQVYWPGSKGQFNLPAFKNKQSQSTGDVKSAGSSTDESDAAAEADFEQLVGRVSQGSLARFLQDRLKLLVWYRPPANPEFVFGAQLRASEVIEKIRPLVLLEETLESEIHIAVLNEKNEPVMRVPTEGKFNGATPFETVDIGEALPHWKVAVYLSNPKQIGRAAQSLATILSMIIILLVLVIALGGWLIAREMRRELVLAQQRTDFVSNVSHELKTPLTSIRLFSELLTERRVTDVERQQHYLNIISAESARLTRLINNVLDFSRLSRGEKNYRLVRCDAAQIVREAISGYRPQLEEKGFALRCDVPESPVWIKADPDGIAQVLVNLISNAEKYSRETKEIAIKLNSSEPADDKISVRVLDRGIGVPAGCEKRIFEQFFRAHDTLSSGIPGSGLGLTLARQIARANEGEVFYEPRAGGGSIFTLELTKYEEAHPGC